MVELSSTHPGGLDGRQYTAILVYPGVVEVVVGHLFECWLDRERRMIWGGVGVAAALVEIGSGVFYYPTFPALVAMVELAVVHHSAGMPIAVVRSVLVLQ